VFAGTEEGGIFKSTDRGATWKHLVNTPSFPRALAISPEFATDRTLYVGSFGNGVYKSTDAGSTWARVSTGLSSLRLTALAISPYFLTDQTLYAGTDGGGVSKTTDGGKNWRDVNTGMVDEEKGRPRITDLEISPFYFSDSTVFAATYDNGVFVTTNVGGSWSPANRGLISLRVNALAISPQFNTDKTMYAGSSWGGIFRSTDGGQTWAQYNNGLPGEYVVTVCALEMSPLFADDHTLFAGTCSRGVYSSTDGGESWTGLNDGLQNQQVRSLAFAPTAPGTLFAGMTGGTTWARALGSAPPRNPILWLPLIFKEHVQ